MYDEWPHAAIYLSATASSYWKWSAVGQEIAWSDDHTIAFFPELSAVLERLSIDGLPPLGSILLLLAACRENWHEPPSRRGLLTSVLTAESAGDSMTLLWEVCNGLDAVHALPRDLRHSLQAKAELASLVFENAPSRLNPQVSQAVVKTLTGDWGGSNARPSQPVTLSYWLVRDLGALREGLRRVNENALRLRLGTGLETMPEPAPVEPPPLQGRAWLGWLEQQEEFAGLARLAKRLLAVIHIPRHLHDADDLPVGGVTDIAPRGPLDRLLLSELVHDDLTLAVRVAMNEALYLRRESPPRTPPRQRHILLDAGLRLWGLPRLYATAVGLAMTSIHDPHLEICAHRAAGQELEPVTMNTAEGLREHLGALDHRLHPGDSLPAFAELLDGDEGDSVIVTSTDTLAEPAFQRALERSPLGTVYLAVVSRDGRFELQQHSRAGMKRLGTAQLQLDEILKEPVKKVPLRNTSREPLPAIFGAEPFPLLLSVQATLENSWHVKGLGLLTLREGRLLLWKGPGQGARQIGLGLPRGKIHSGSCTTMNWGQACLIVGRLSPSGLHAIWVSINGEVERTVALRCTLTNVLSVAADHRFAYVRSIDAFEAIDLQTGKSVGSCRLGRKATVFGLYVVDDLLERHQKITWSKMSGTHDSANLIHAYSVLPNHSFQLIRMFDIEGMEGCAAITNEHHLFIPATQETRRIEHGLKTPLAFLDISRDGLRFRLGSSHKTVTVETQTGAVYIGPLEPQLREIARPRTLRHRFHGVWVNSRGELSLISTKKSAWTLSMPSLTFPEQAEPQPGFGYHAFEEWWRTDFSGIKLERAKFPDGTIAVLDSRGLLHLCSSDKRLPECTIVLTEGLTAGWCSDGRMWGPRYFVEESRPTFKPETIARDVIEPILERLR